jgi:hypothetical protein
MLFSLTLGGMGIAIETTYKKLAKEKLSEEERVILMS